MVEDFSISAVLLIAGWCLFVRRDAWRCKLERALTASVVLIIAGVVLTSPMISDLDSSLLLKSVGVQHFDDYLGHVCFLSAVATVAYAILARTVPDRYLRRAMRRRVEYPTAAAALLMLILVTVSPVLRSGTPLKDDFFTVSGGAWLHAYWTVYSAAVIYLMGYIIRLLLVLRQDPRSRLTANLYLAACVLGIIGVFVEFLDTWFYFMDGILWLLLTAPGVMASIAAALSWLRQPRRGVDRCETPPRTPKIPT